MTVRVERTFDLAAPPADVWAFIADPRKRAEPISVVEEFEVTGDHTAIWHVALPIPYTDRTIAVETEDTRVDEPSYVEFVGRSKAMNVQGEHTLEPTDDGGTRLINRFVVDGKVPGVERYFKGKLDGELQNLEAAIRADLGLAPGP
ncbi:SRPBCC family protein [Haloglomus halophilum]|uniref:SRPBCC family protein n=1 Tax=Haloglomus halophilum TaxID=2962672 RepID=UPI0020C9BBB8|nr:SRPBCC family protein [Haloglomus halophilum]